MRPPSLAFCAVLLFIAADAAAQSIDYPATGPGAISSVEVTGRARPQHVPHEELEAVSGMFALSNGWRLRIEPGGESLISARIDRQRPMRLSAVSADTFATADGNVSMKFDQDRDELVMRYVPQSRLAAVVEVRAALAQR